MSVQVNKELLENIQLLIVHGQEQIDNSIKKKEEHFKTEQKITDQINNIGKAIVILVEHAKNSI